MRNRRKTIESLRRLAERPGTPSEGETARRLLAEMLGRPVGIAFRAEDFPLLAEVWYAYWCYRNEHGYIACKAPKTIHGQTWVRIKFDHLKQPRWVPVVSEECGCHISRTPFSSEEAERLHDMGMPTQPDWEALLRSAAAAYAQRASA